jgi:hypothetical protein
MCKHWFVEAEVQCGDLSWWRQRREEVQPEFPYSDAKPCGVGIEPAVDRLALKGREVDRNPCWLRGHDNQALRRRLVVLASVVRNP